MWTEIKHALIIINYLVSFLFSIPPCVADYLDRMNSGFVASSFFFLREMWLVLVGCAIFLLVYNWPSHFCTC